MGNTLKQLSRAKKLIKKYIGHIANQSSIYATAPWGDTAQADFLNQVIIIETELTAVQTMSMILSIEKQMGRKRTKINAPRTIDIDILFFNKSILDNPDLVVPHPQIANRNFVLVPLSELSPNLIHPVYKQTIHYLLKKCPDRLAVNKI
jgi:2-amino-4-hydroxy-6-hydroxymethyldihydropteridine diphosphokinase